MSDNRFLTDLRGPHMDPRPAMVVRDGGYEVARTLRLMAVISIGARLFLTYTSANRISVVHSLLNQIPANARVVNGRFSLTGQAGAADLIASAQDADNLVRLAWIVTVVVLVLFLLTLFSVHRRRKHDTLAAAIDKNRAIRFASRLYLVPTFGSAIAQSAFSSSSDMTPWDRLHRATHIDVTNIVLQMFVIAFLLIVALATSRELRDATIVPVLE